MIINQKDSNLEGNSFFNGKYKSSDMVSFSINMLFQNVGIGWRHPVVQVLGYSRVLMENDTMSDDLYLPLKNELPSRLESFWFIIIIRPIIFKADLFPCYY
jgi:hypothetical protein